MLSNSAALLTVQLLTVLLAWAAPAGAQTRIGLAAPITGPYAEFGTQMTIGAQQAIADLNAKGGVLGQPLVLDIADDACDPKQALMVARKFAGDGVKLVDGHFCSSSSIATAKPYADAGILLITPASSDPRLTESGGWNLFRTCGRDDQQAATIGHGLATVYKSRRVAILHDGSAYGKAIADLTKAAANAEGKQEILYLAYPPGSRDYAPIIGRLKEQGAEVAVLAGSYTDIGLIVRQAREQGLATLFITPDRVATKEFWQVAGPAAEGVLTSFPADPRERPQAQDVLAEFQAQGIGAAGYTLAAYAAIQVWAQAAAKAGTLDSRKLADSLRAGAWPSVLGDIAYNAKGDITRNDYVWYVWHGGDLVRRK